jgi:hypothetical protein
VYSAVLHQTLPEVYFYEFNRSYQLSFYSPNYPICEAPIRPGYPHGDPSAEYFKCHSGELYYVFGTLLFNGLPPRDDYDIPMSQFTVDTWSAFVRTYNPTPDPAFLQVRGFVNTTNEIARAATPWLSVGVDNLTLRLMQDPSVDEPFGIYGRRRECDALGFPRDYYEEQAS